MLLNYQLKYSHFANLKNTKQFQISKKSEVYSQKNDSKIINEKSEF